MDIEPEDFQFITLPSIFLASITTIFNPNHFKLFSQITLSFILPISILFLLHIQIYLSLLFKIERDQTAFQLAPSSSPSKYRLLHLLTSAFALAVLFKAIYMLFLLIFSLLAYSAIIYTVACIFTSKTLTLKKVLSVVPKVWMRLMETFFWAFQLYSVFHIASGITTVIFLIHFKRESLFGVLLGLTMIIAYFVGLALISVVWHVATVVSVLEDFKGVDALKKSWNLLKGKTVLSSQIFMVLNLFFFGIETGFTKIVLKGKGIGVNAKIGVVVAMLVLLVAVILIGLVVQTLVYFVCKSYHHENIDRPSLADHLEVYLGEYVPLKEKEVQMDSFSL